MQETPTEFAAFIGIDWADRKHDFCIHVPGVKKREKGVIEHKPAVLDGWARRLRERFGGAAIAVAATASPRRARFNATPAWPP